MDTQGGPPGPYKNNIIDFSARRPRPHAGARILRITSESDGLRALYSNDLHDRQLMALDIIGWALFEDGSIDALVPWLQDVVPAGRLADPLNGHCQGCWDPRQERLLVQPPPHKLAELQAARAFFSTPPCDADAIVQDIPDVPGTHAALAGDQVDTVRLLEVISWQLRGDGRVLAMLIDEQQIIDTPVRLDDDSLYPAQEHPAFRYFFQHRVANQLKRGEPQAMSCLAMLARRSE